MNKLLQILILVIIPIGAYSQSNLDTTNIKLIYRGQEFKDYHSKIQSCNPCFLIVKNSNDSIIANSIGTQIGNQSHHFHVLKPDSVIQSLNPLLNTSIISAWPKDSIVNFIRNNVEYRDSF